MIKTGFKGHFKLEVRDAETNDLKKVREFDNLITNRGLDGFGLCLNPVSHCCVGTGTNAPAVTDTMLGAYKNRAGRVSVSKPVTKFLNDNTLYEESVVLYYRFGVNTVTGNLTEVGICNNYNQNHNDFCLWSRALILDEDNNPTALPVKENEYLDVYYTLYLYADATVKEFSFKIDDETYNATVKLISTHNALYNSGNFNFIYRPVVINNTYDDEGNRGLDSRYMGDVKWFDYAPGTFYRDNEMPIGLNQCNIKNGILKLSVSPYFQQETPCLHYYITLDHPIPKTSLNSYKLKFRQSWGRYEEP